MRKCEFERSAAVGADSDVTEDEAITIGGECEWRIKQTGVVDCLRHARSDAVIGVLGLHHRNRYALVEKHIVREQRRLFVSNAAFAPDNDSPRLQRETLANLQLQIPASRNQRWRDELAANVLFAEMRAIRCHR